VLAPARDDLSVLHRPDYSHHNDFVANARRDAQTYPYPITGSFFKVVDGELREP